MTTSANAVHAAPEGKKVVHAHPTKDFFVTMITKDIGLKDCVFDLLDNSIDGAHRTAGSTRDGRPYEGFEVAIAYSSSNFQIADNCGGITLHDAISYAFHFGRKANAPTDVSGGIGLYGIGMKRAIFKIGRKCSVTSKASDAAFRVDVDVDAWLRDPDNWDFSYDDIRPGPGANGTLIQIESLNPGVNQMFGDPEFTNSLIREIARDYSFFIQKGLKVTVCGRTIPSYQYRLSTSQALQPLVDSYVDEGVSVRILAGIADEMPDDVPEDLRPNKVERLGWFVICNDRIVLAADKTERTVWGNDNFQIWHNQYTGFAGFVFFAADDQRKLPWTTTKRDIELELPLYRRALIRMKAATAEFIKYTQVRSAALDQAKRAESAATFVDISTLRGPQPMKLPVLHAAATKPSHVSILYQKPIAAVDEIKKELKRPRMSASEVGRYTFDYYRRVELGKS